MSTIQTMRREEARGQLRAGAWLPPLASFWASLRKRRELRHTRLNLIELTDDQLRDIGITREAAEREALRSTLVHYLHNAR